jgi:hypothetical protein
MRCLPGRFGREETLGRDSGAVRETTAVEIVSMLMGLINSLTSRIGEATEIYTFSDEHEQE